MEFQLVMVNGKTRQAWERRGILWLRCAYDLEMNHAEKFESKVRMMGEKPSAVVRKLIMSFNLSTGLNDDRVKNPGSLFEYRIEPHIREACRRARQEVFGWSEN